MNAIVLISGKKIVEKMEVTVVGTMVESKWAIKYLRVIINDRLSFKEHVKYIGEKASVTQGALGRLMPNIGGACPFKRRIILAVVTLIILYTQRHFPWRQQERYCPRCII